MATIKMDLPNSSICPTCGKPSNDEEIADEVGETILVNQLPKEVLSMIGEYLPLADLMNFGLGCKIFRESTLHVINKRRWMKLTFGFTNTFANRIKKFCKDVRPVLLPKTSNLQLWANVFRYKAQAMPNQFVIENIQNISDRLVHVAKRNESYTVKEVLGMFVEVELKVGIGAEWHVPCFVELWNLVASENVERIKVVFYFGENMASVITESHISQLENLNSVKQLSLRSHVRAQQENMSRTVFNGLFAKFLNLKEAYIFPANAAESFVNAVNHMGQKVWKTKICGNLTVAQKIGV